MTGVRPAPAHPDQTAGRFWELAAFAGRQLGRDKARIPLAEEPHDHAVAREPPFGLPFLRGPRPAPAKFPDRLLARPFRLRAVVASRELRGFDAGVPRAKALYDGAAARVSGGLLPFIESGRPTQPIRLGAQDRNESLASPI
jgi:hypothetical protein